jgi:hypothetical protein
MGSKFWPDRPTNFLAPSTLAVQSILVLFQNILTLSFLSQGWQFENPTQKLKTLKVGFIGCFEKITFRSSISFCLPNLYDNQPCSRIWSHIRQKNATEISKRNSPSTFQLMTKSLSLISPDCIIPLRISPSKTSLIWSASYDISLFLWD